jgi:hypothetical protein
VKGEEDEEEEEGERKTEVASWQRFHDGEDVELGDDAGE